MGFSQLFWLSAEVRDELIEIQVKDNGSSPLPANFEKLFSSDFSLSSMESEGGSAASLGLALCREFIERNGGEIKIEAGEKKGSTFIFTLPAWSFAELT